MNSSNSSGKTTGGGNTQTPPVKKQISPRIHHFFTYNNYNSSDIILLTDTFNKIAYKYCFQEETGENGTPHLQGIISLHKKSRDSEFNLPKQIHWEKPRKIEEAYLYCCKEESRTGKIFKKNYNLPYKFKIEKPMMWHQKVWNIIKEEPDYRKIHWFWSEEGNLGKSIMAKDLVMNHNAVFCCKGKYSDIINILFNTDMNERKIVVFDLPRNNGNKISYDAIESIKNGLICNTKFETGYKAFGEVHILVFANMEPDYTKLSEDRWEVHPLSSEYC